MNIEDFKRHFYETLEDINEREERREQARREQREQAIKEVKEQPKERMTRERRKQATRVKQILKTNYRERIYCYTIYDLKDNERIQAQFNNLDDLLNYIHKYENTSTSKASLQTMISQGNAINERYIIVKDKYVKEDFKDDYKQGITYDNKTYIYE